jgi:carbon storage regulator
MLILTRKVGQSIVIADEIEITVVEVRGEQIRLGISAPQNISIYRKELLDQIAAENLASVETFNITTQDLEEILVQTSVTEPQIEVS